MKFCGEAQVLELAFESNIIDLPEYRALRLSPLHRPISPEQPKNVSITNPSTCQEGN